MALPEGAIRYADGADDYKPDLRGWRVHTRCGHEHDNIKAMWQHAVSLWTVDEEEDAISQQPLAQTPPPPVVRGTPHIPLSLEVDTVLALMKGGNVRGVSEKLATLSGAEAAAVVLALLVSLPDDSDDAVDALMEDLIKSSGRTWE